MKVLIGCEESQAVCKAFRLKGIEAYSCDVEDCSGNHPEWHLKMDVFKAIKLKKWDMGIFFPPCTRLTNSVWWYIKRNNLYEEVEKAADFFNKILYCDIPKVVIENPVQHTMARNIITKYNQTIQPYNFGEDASKRTCLWLKNVPLLKNTNYFPPRMVNGKPKWSNQTDGGWNKLPPSKDRAKIRSKTYQGIANAMAEQWSKIV